MLSRPASSAGHRLCGDAQRAGLEQQAPDADLASALSADACGILQPARLDAREERRFLVEPVLGQSGQTELAVLRHRDRRPSRLQARSAVSNARGG